MTPSEQRNLSSGVMYAIVASDQALTDAKWKPQTVKERTRTGNINQLPSAKINPQVIHAFVMRRSSPILIWQIWGKGSYFLASIEANLGYISQIF